MFIVADEGALWVGGKRGFSGTGEAEENRRVFTGGVGRAVHGENAFLREDEVHHGED